MLMFEGDIPDLFSDDEVESIISSIKMELQGLSQADSRGTVGNFLLTEFVNS